MDFWYWNQGEYNANQQLIDGLGLISRLTSKLIMELNLVLRCNNESKNKKSRFENSTCEKTIVFSPKLVLKGPN
jgi:hypothetical protein